MTIDEDLVCRIISQLPEQKREIIRLRIGYRLEWSNISKRLNISENRCMVVYSETFKKLKNNLRGYM